MNALKLNGGTSSPDPLFVGVDVGGTFVKLGIVDGQGTIAWNDKFETGAHCGPRVAMQETRRLVEHGLKSLKREWNDVAAIGLGTPGPIDVRRGVILNPGNLPEWHGAPIRDILSSECRGLAVKFTNDANAAAYGEFWVGAGRGAHSLLLLTLGTGVGGGLIIEGHCVEGHNSSAAEVGHICVDYRSDARCCTCGQRGHLEAYASATALVARIRESMQAGKPSSLRAAVDDGQTLDARLVGEHAQAGDSLALGEVLATADFLARGIADLAHVIDPELFILGGAMNFGGIDSPLGRQFIERIELGARRLVFPVICERFKIVYSQLGSDAGWVGAAGLARHERLRSLST